MELAAETWPGAAGESPLVLLHGFGARAAVWRPLAGRLSRLRPIVAYDLPGHADSLVSEPGGAGRVAKAVLADLDARGIRELHLCGHSLGGAAAALLALRMPERLQSLTLLAPGGFGREINAGALAAWRDATGPRELARALEAMTARGFRFEDETLRLLAEGRAMPGAGEALGAIYRSMFAGEGQQGVLPVARLADVACPVHVLWGTEDEILPVSQAQGLPEKVTVTRLAGAGHMLIEEAAPSVEAALSSLS